MSYGTDFVNSFNSGLNTGNSMRRRNALMSAGSMAAQGDAKGGQNALLQGGFVEEAGQFRQLGEQQRQDTYRERTQQAVQGAGNDYRKQLEAMSGVAMEFDPEDAMRYRSAIEQMDDKQRQQWAQTNDALGAFQVGLVSSQVPVEQRKQRAVQMAPQLAQQTGLAPEKIVQMIEQLPDWSDQALVAAARGNMSAADAVQEYLRQGERAQDIQYRGERDAVGDRQWAATFGEQRRARQAAEEAAMVRAMGNGQSGGGVSVDPETGALTVAGGPALKEQEAKFGLYASQANDALQALQSMDGQGFDKGDAASGVYQAVRNAGVPGVAPNLGRDVTDWIPGTQRNRQYEFQTQRFIDGWARAMTGAAMTREETEMYKRMLMPQPGEGPEVLEQKRAARERMAQDLVGAAGRGARIAATPTNGGNAPPTGGGQRRRFNPETGRIE